MRSGCKMKPQAVEHYLGQFVHLDLGRTGYVGVVKQVLDYSETVILDPAQHLSLDERSPSLMRMKLAGGSLDPQKSLRTELNLDDIVGISTFPEKED